jgi:hypothetical protein
MSSFDRRSAAYWKEEYEKALPAARLVEEYRWQLTRAKSALENWGSHFGWCQSRYIVPFPCNCGYEQALRDAEPVSPIAAGEPTTTPETSE